MMALRPLRGARWGRPTPAVTSNPVIAGSSLVAYGMSTSTGRIAYQSTLHAEVPDRLRSVVTLWVRIGRCLPSVAEIRVVPA